MRARPWMTALIVVCLVSIPLLAEEPPAELSQLSFFSGSWGCTGMAFETPFGPEHPTEATVSGGPAVGGSWVQLVYDEKKTAENPMPVHALLVMGYDVEKKEFVSVCFDSFGQHCAESSSGWNGDVMILEGHSSMGDTGVRDTFTKKGRNSLTHLGEMQSPDGTWMKLDQETCSRK